MQLKQTAPRSSLHTQRHTVNIFSNDWYADKGIKIEDMKGKTCHFYASSISIAVCLQITPEQSHLHDWHDWHKQHEDKTSSKSADGDSVNTGHCSAFQAEWQTNIWHLHTICAWAATAQQQHATVWFLRRPNTLWLVRRGRKKPHEKTEVKESAVTELHPGWRRADHLLSVPTGHSQSLHMSTFRNGKIFLLNMSILIVAVLTWPGNVKTEC